MTIHARESTPNRSTPSKRTKGGTATKPTAIGKSWPTMFQVVLRASRRPLVRSGAVLVVTISQSVTGEQLLENPNQTPIVDTCAVGPTVFPEPLSRRRPTRLRFLRG